MSDNSIIEARDTSKNTDKFYKILDKIFNDIEEFNKKTGHKPLYVAMSVPLRLILSTIAECSNLPSGSNLISEINDVPVESVQVRVISSSGYFYSLVDTLEDVHDLL